MKKTLTWITWLSLNAVTPFALAVELGQADVSSYLSAPLNASIPLLESSDYALDDIRVSVAEPADFAASGLEWTPLAASVRTQIVEQQGHRQVRLSSSQTIQEPWLDLLLAVEFPGGQQFRDITLLFDPQGYSQQGQAQSAVSNAVPTTSNATTPPGAEARSAAPPVVSEHGMSSAYVGSGDTLWSVAERLKPSQASVQQMMVALLVVNPEAFPSGNINDMRASQTLRVPSTERILARSHLDADAAIKAMNDAWRSSSSGSLQAVSLPEVDSVAVTASQTLATNGASEAANALAAGGSEIDEPEALTRAELTEQLRLSQTMLQQVLDERELMHTDLNELRSEVVSLTQALSAPLAVQQPTPEVLIASMGETDRPGVAAWLERYQWSLALAAIALLVALLVWLRKRRKEAWEDVPLAAPVVKPTATPSAAPKAGFKTAPMPETVPVAYPIQANNDVVEEPHQQSGPLAPDNGSEHLSLAPPLSSARMGLLLASLSADLKSAEPAAPADHVQPTERAPKRSEDAEHRLIDYHPPALINTPSSQEGPRTETLMQPTVEFASQPDADPVSPEKQPRRPIEEEWEIEEVAFKPRGLDNSEPSKSSK